MSSIKKLSRSSRRIKAITGSIQRTKTWSATGTDVPAASPDYINDPLYKRVFIKYTSTSSVNLGISSFVGSGFDYVTNSSVIGAFGSPIGVNAHIIGGGGSSSGVKRTGGGGGGGYHFITNLAIVDNTAYPIVVGAAQGTSSFFGFTSSAGGIGGGENGPGSPGGSGGGAGGSDGFSGATRGEAVAAQNNSGVPWNRALQGAAGAQSPSQGGGGGGGAGGASGNPNGYDAIPSRGQPGGAGLVVYGDTVAGGGQGGFGNTVQGADGPAIGGGGGGGGDQQAGRAGRSGGVYISFLKSK